MMAEKIKRFNIADVARIHGIQVIKETGGDIYAVCPFCGNKEGKFSYIVKKGKKQNIYNCFVCDNHGGAIDLHINLSDGNYQGEEGRKKAAKEIFEILQNDNEMIEYHNFVTETHQDTEEAYKTSDEHCSYVYYSMLKELELKDEHKKDLLRRGLTEEDIKRFKFKSTPDNKYKVCKSLVEKGIYLEGVPGFFKNQKGNWDINIPGKGYFCPVFDGEKNLIIGFQIRVDKPVKKSKYLWFSSAGKELGVTSGAISTFLPGDNDRVIIITEGVLKANVIYALLKGAVSVIGVPGVKSIAGIEDYLNRHYSNAYVYEAYDMDKAIKTDDPEEQKKTDRIKNAAISLKTLVEDYGIEVHSLTWDYDNDGFWKGEYKGLDDFLLSYDKKDLFLRYILSKALKKLKIKDFFE